MNQQFGIPYRLRGFAALVLGAALCMVFAGTALAVPATHVVNNAAGCNDDLDTSTPFCHIQAAIDAAAAGDTINVYPGSYSETASGRSAVGLGGTYQFGLYVGDTMDGLTIQGVDAGGTPIAAVPTTSTDMPVVTTNATNNFGPSGIWVEADNVTISGLRILNNVGGDNKALEITGNAFTLKYSHMNATGGGSVYFNDVRYDDGTNTAYLQSYTIEGNLFSLGGTIDITSGAGASGPVTGRKIINNQWPTPPANSRALISFSGSSVVPWFVDPVGGAQITGNTFGAAPQYVRARGVYTEGDFDWASYWNGNTFAKAAIVGENPPANVRAYSYTTTYGLMTNVRQIGGLIQPEIDHAQPGDTVLIKAGLYEENLTVNKHVKLVGAGSGSDPATSTVIRRVPGTAGSAAVVVAASGQSNDNPLLLANLRLEPNGSYGINAGSNVSYLRISDVQIVGLSTTHVESEVCFKVSTTSNIQHLVVENSAFNSCDHGWYFAKDGDWGPNGSNVRNVIVRNSTFADNGFKGIYVEKLSDALFENVFVLNNGSNPNWNQAWNGGIDINLKGKESYQNLTFRNLAVTGNGLGFQHGAGLMIKARDEAGHANYGPNPATLTNVLIEGGVFTGNERGIRFGEPVGNASFGDNNGPTNVVIRGASIHGNTKTYGSNNGSAYGDLINYTKATVDARGNWWGIAAGPGPMVVSTGWWGNATTPASGKIVKASTGDVLYDPFLTSAPSSATLVVPDALYRIPTTQITVKVPVRFNAPSDESLAALAFALTYETACLSNPVVTAGNSLQGHTLTPGTGTSGKIDVAVTYVGTEDEPLKPLLSGTLLEVEFTLDGDCREEDVTTPIGFATSPLSAGTVGGQSYIPTTQNGSITLDFNQDGSTVSLSPSRVYEGMLTGELVGTLSNNDPDAWETFSYALTGGPNDNSLFTISGNQVLANGSYTAGSSYTIEVTATGSAGTVITQTITITASPASTLSLPGMDEVNGTYGVVGSTVSVPVTFAANGNSVTEAAFSVDYDASCLSFTSATGQPEGWTVTTSPGASSASVTMSGPTALANGHLVDLNFIVGPLCAGYPNNYPSPLTFPAAPVMSDAAGRVSASGTNGVVYVIANDARGDCNVDAKVDAGDFSAVVLEYFDGDGSGWLHAPMPTFRGSPRGCDANTSKLIDIADLTCTVNVVFGNTACTSGSSAAADAAAATPAALALAKTAANGYVDLPVTFRSNGYAVAAAAFVVNYDPAKYMLDMADADQDGIPDAVTFHTPANIMRWAIMDEAGKLKIAAAGLQLPLPALADGPIATVRLRATAGADGAISLSDASLGGTDGFGVPVTVSGPGGAAVNGGLYLPSINR